MEKTAFLKKQRSIMKKTTEFLLIKFIITAVVAAIDMLLVVIRLPVAAMGICGMIFCVVVYITCMNEMNEAFVSVFRWNASNDSFAAFALILVFIRSFSLIFLQGANTEIFSPMLFLSISVSMCVKRSYALSISKNLETIKDSDTYLVGSIKDSDGKKYVKTGKSEELPDIVSKSYIIDPSERRGRKLVPIIYIMILILSLAVMWLKGLSMFFTAAAVMSVMAASLSGEMAFVVPYNTLQARMRRQGKIFFGYTSIAALKDVTTVVIDDSELFVKEETSIKKITIKSTQTETTVRYIDRILKEIDSPAKTALDNLSELEGGLPLSVESIKYIKNQGIQAVINEDKVFFGNRSLLLANNIEPYSQEKEASLLEDNTVMMYLSINGELSAAILFEYVCDGDFKKKISDAAELEFLIKTRDAAIDVTTIEKNFGIKKSKIRITDETDCEFFEDYERKLISGETKAAMITTNGASEIPNLIVLARDMASVFKYTIISKHIGIIIGILLCFAALILAPAALNFAWILLYNIIWFIPLIFLSSYRRK